MGITEKQIIEFEISYLVREFKEAKKNYEKYKVVSDKDKGNTPFYCTRTDTTFGIMLAYEMSLKHLLYMIYGCNMDFDKYIEEYKE